VKAKGKSCGRIITLNIKSAKRRGNPFLPFAFCLPLAFAFPITGGQKTLAGRRLLNYKTWDPVE
jgi:hypothetical protein